MWRWPNHSGKNLCRQTFAQTQLNSTSLLSLKVFADRRVFLSIAFVLFAAWLKRIGFGVQGCAESALRIPKGVIKGVMSFSPHATRRTNRTGFDREKNAQRQPLVARLIRSRCAWGRRESLFSFQKMILSVLSVRLNAAVCKGFNSEGCILIELSTCLNLKACPYSPQPPNLSS